MAYVFNATGEIKTFTDGDVMRRAREIEKEKEKCAEIGKSARCYCIYGSLRASDGKERKVYSHFLAELNYK